MRTPPGPRSAAAPAFVAYHADRHTDLAAAPALDRCRVVERAGRAYVVLTAGDGRTLAVFRQRTDGVLKGLRRPPRVLAPDWYEYPEE